MDKIKQYGMIALAVFAVAAIAWGIFKPAEKIEQDKFTRWEDTTKIKNIQSQLNAAMTAKSVVDKKLAEAIETNKNINIEIEYYPDGKIKSKKIVDKTTVSKKSDSESTATSTSSATTAAKVAETDKEETKKKETEDKKTTTNPARIFSTGTGYMNDSSLLFKQGIDLFNDGEFEAIIKKNLKDSGIYYGGILSIKYNLF